MKVSIIAASTLCGRIGPGFKGGPEDRAFLEEMRERTQASLIGAGTFRLGDCEMRGRGGCIIDGRIRAIVSGSGNIPLTNRKIFSEGPRPIVFTLAENAVKLGNRVKGAARVIGCGGKKGKMDLAEVFGALKDLGVESVLVEGGSTLNYEVLKAGLCREIFCTVSPKLLGVRGAPSLVDGPLPLGDPFIHLVLKDVRYSKTSGDVFLHYEVFFG